MSEDAFDPDLTPMITDDSVVVDVSDVMPELADPEVVAEIVATTREIDTPLGKPLVELRKVTVRFGGLVALDSVTFDINRGEILGLIGPNGAGKMTALENVVVGTDARHRTSVPGALFRVPRHRHEERDAIDRGMALLEFVGIGARATEKSRNLPYGDQRRLEIARALATEPKLLCLDEPAAGFNPAEKAALMDLIRKIRSDGYTVLLIEHDMRLVMGVTDRIVVLEFGKKIAEGLPSEIRDNPSVIAAYLGVPDDATA